MNLFLILIILISNSNGFKILPASHKFPKISFSTIHDISLKKPLVYRPKKSIVLKIIKNIDKLYDTLINNHCNLTNIDN